MRCRRWGVGALAAIVVGGLTGAPARAAYAPLDAAGPKLTVPTAQLEASLRCTGGLAGAGRDPVLLVPGTTVDTREDFSWNWERALKADGVPFCTVDPPAKGMGDIQVSAEYVVHALRRVAKRSGRRVDVVGHSQGGMVPRWALRFWPDTRKLVDDLVGLAPSNHGTDVAVPLCAAPGGCAASIWQQRTGSAFVTALDSRAQTFPGIDYSVVSTRTDEVVAPQGPDGRSALHGGGGTIRNVALQEVCPLAVDEHLATGSYSAPGYALARDALDHPGPVDPARVDRGVCAQPFQPGVDPLTFPTTVADAFGSIPVTLARAPRIAAEPPLRCYVTASCPKPKPKPKPGRRRR